MAQPPTTNLEELLLKQAAKIMELELEISRYRPYIHRFGDTIFIDYQGLNRRLLNIRELPKLSASRYVTRYEDGPADD